jgi:hypothetical protein
MVEASVERPSQTRGTRLLSLIGRQEWLDRPSYRFEHLVGIAFNSLGRSRDRVANAPNPRSAARQAPAARIPGHRCSHAPWHQARSHPQRKSREDG